MAIGVVFGGPAPEHDISILTGLQACRAVGELDEKLVAIYWDKTGMFYQVSASLEAPDFSGGVPSGAEPIMLVAGSPSGFVSLQGGLRARLRAVDCDVVINCCHGGPGEDGTLQGAFDLAGIAYTGPSARSAALGMDKLSFAAVMVAAGLPVLPRVAGDRTPPFDGPYIAKPRFGGSSIGIEVIEDAATLAIRCKSSVHLRDGAVVEPFRPDLYDLQLAVRGGSTPVFSAIERPLRQGGNTTILSYADKYRPGGGMATAPRELPAVVAPEIAKEIHSVAEQVASIMDVRGVMRIDFLASDDGELVLNEVNTIPGSLSHYLFVDPKISFSAQLAADIREARERPTYRPVTAGSDGLVLRSAGTIAAKLA
ncbi:MAG: D-alanine--D-alanine ligase family protein [Ferrimicrobium sp.]